MCLPYQSLHPHNFGPLNFSFSMVLMHLSLHGHRNKWCWILIKRELSSLSAFSSTVDNPLLFHHAFLARDLDVECSVPSCIECIAVLNKVYGVSAGFPTRDIRRKSVPRRWILKDVHETMGWISLKCYI